MASGVRPVEDSSIRRPADTDEPHRRIRGQAAPVARVAQRRDEERRCRAVLHGEKRGCIRRHADRTVGVRVVRGFQDVAAREADPPDLKWGHRVLLRVEQQLASVRNPRQRRRPSPPGSAKYLLGAVAGVDDHDAALLLVAGGRVDRDARNGPSVGRPRRIVLETLGDLTGGESAFAAAIQVRENDARFASLRIVPSKDEPIPARRKRDRRIDVRDHPADPAAANRHFMQLIDLGR